MTIGRPATSPEKRRDVIVSFRLTPSQGQQLEAIAHSLDFSTGQVVRMWVLERLQHFEKPQCPQEKTDSH